MSRLVDFHCHLDLYPDLQVAIDDAEAAGVYTLTVTTTPKAWPRNRDLTKRTKYVRSALGMHPQLVSTHAHEYPIWEQYLSEARYVGEVGLDAGPRFYSSFDTQKEIFSRVLKQCASVGGKIFLTVHSVRSTRQVMDALEAHFPRERGRAVLHWFTGSASEARRAVEHGCYFSVNAAMLKNDRGKKIAESLPLERILTETDGPFTVCDDRVARPADAIHVVEGLASLRKIDVDVMSRTIIGNLRELTSSTEGFD